MIPEVDNYFNSDEDWQDEMKRLRTLVLDCGLAEEWKWNQPCYTYQGKNILIISGFKAYCALNFFKGALLKDPEHLLVKAGPNQQSARQIRFSDVNQIDKLETSLKSYIADAIEVEKSGLKINSKKVSDYAFPEELKNKFNEKPEFKRAFESLTPGRQRAYLLYFSGAKQSKTRSSRVMKYIPRILEGKGINDCVCGYSKRMPNCDGSHKYIK
jgi:uncharacterized protein YdeI (YjbR/CyaY-like superfamily)